MLKSFLICYYGFMVAKLKKIFETIKQKYTKTLATLKNILYLCTRNAQMAESVDALVSNTSGAIRPGSTPGLGTSKRKCSKHFLFFYSYNSRMFRILYKIALILQ